MPDKMVYDWEDKRDECYVMYITENKSLDDIIEFYKRKNFAPRYVVDSTAPTADSCALAVSVHTTSPVNPRGFA